PRSGIRRLDSRQHERGPRVLPLRLRGFGGRRLRGRRQIRGIDPTGLDSRLHDDPLGVFAGDLEAVENARMTNGLALLALAPAGKLVGGAAGEVLDRLETGLAARDVHGRGDAAR